MELRKKLGLDQIFNEIKEGLNPSEISKKHNIPKQTLAYSLNKLKKLGCIEKVGYGTWEVLKEVPTKGEGTNKVNSDLPINEIRGHAFIWKIEFAQPYNWIEVIRKYKKKKLSFSVVCKGRIPRTIFNGRKIWLTKKGLTIYEPLDFLGKSSFQVKGTAVYEMDRLIKGLLRETGLKFKIYRFTTSREHYGMIKNELARQYNDKGEKMIIRDQEGTAWLWIDDSKGLGELETGDPHLSRKVQNFWNNHKKHDFKHDGDYIDRNFKESAKQIGQNAENLAYHAENMRSHVGAVKELALGVRELREEIKSMREERMSKK